MSSISQYFAGKVQVKTLTETGHVSTECDFQHVVLADNDDEAHEKVIAYYSDKSTYYEEFSLNVIEIFDFIA